MDEKKLREGLKKLRESSKKRKFDQTVDVIFVLKYFQKTDKVDFFVDLHNPRGKKTKVGALVGTELAEQAKKVCDMCVVQDNFAQYAKDKKATKKLANEHDYFIAQANIMTDIAKTFGRIFGPRNKMPNPKAGCVVPASANLKPLYDRLQNRIRVMSNKNQNWMIQCAVASEGMADEQIIDNIMTVYNSLIANLPSGINNYKKGFIKLTMSPAVGVD
ncbi:50S ribosomal protein L1 [Candidatus Woesearchaeota archaeon]|nr:50S ribosomal protein L1 [Candidatus Woesearchaeota archaeon]